jgi:FkbM family methyltransferase
MKTKLNKFLKRYSVQLVSYPNPDYLRRMSLIKRHNINVIFDIGANEGQYGLELREFGYNAKIISFEPLNDAFIKLKANSIKDNNWDAYNYALGNKDEKNFINVSENSYSSSILNMLPSHIKFAPNSQFIKNQEIEVKQFDTIFDSLCKADDSIMIKIDTQGYEKNVIEGANNKLNKVKIVQLEMSLTPLYENEMLITEMILFLASKNFQLFSIENGYCDPVTNQLLQVDGIFLRKDLFEN